MKMKKVFKIIYKLRIYLLIIFLLGCLISLIDYFVLKNLYDTPWYLTILFVFASIIYVIIIDGLTATIVHHLPKKIADPYRFKTKKWEKKFFNFIKIKKWKDYIPEIGEATVDFAKDKLQTNSDSSYLYLFLIEMGYAEIIHIVSFFTGFLIIFLIPLRYALFIGLPVGIINIIFNLLSALIQRYNRPKLLIVYERTKKKEEAAVNTNIN